MKKYLIAIYEKLYYPINLFILHTFYRLRIMNSMRTINYIKKHKCNVSRYGDGEFGLIRQDWLVGFQKDDALLRERLMDVLGNKNVLICVPYYFNSTQDCNKKAGDYWIKWGVGERRQKEIANMLRKKNGVIRLYGDSLISRPYLDKKDIHIAEKIFDNLKTLWNEKNIVIVEGEQTRLGVGNDLFSNASSIKRIIAPAKNAWDKYDEILNTTLKFVIGGGTEAILL